MARRVAQSIIDDVAEEYSSGQLRAIFRKIRRRAEKAARLSEKRARAAMNVDGTPQLPPTDNMGRAIEEPCDVLLSRATKTQIEVEDAIARIRERHIKTIGPAQALFEALAGNRQGAVTVEFAPESEEPKKSDI